jgi:hypothetical protein
VSGRWGWVLWTVEGWLCRWEGRRSLGSGWIFELQKTQDGRRVYKRLRLRGRALIRGGGAGRSEKPYSVAGPYEQMRLCWGVVRGT